MPSRFREPPRTRRKRTFRILGQLPGPASPRFWHDYGTNAAICQPRMHVEGGYKLSGKEASNLAFELRKLELVDVPEERKMLSGGEGVCYHYKEKAEEAIETMGKVTSSKDLIMLLLYAKGHKGERCEPINGRTRLMKMVFLFDREIRRKFNLEKAIPDGAMPDFTPYDYGPFSSDVFSDLEFLVELGFVLASRAGDGESLLEEALEYDYWQAGADLDGEQEGPAYEEKFSLTKLGRDFVKDELKDGLTRRQWATLDEFKARCTAASLRALLRYVYTKYPEMTTESKIRDEVLSEYKF